MALNPSQIGKRLREARERTGMTQGEAADRLNVNYVTVSRWERGLQRLRADNLIALSKLYGEDLTSLASDTPNGMSGVKRGTSTPSNVRERGPQYEAGIAFTASESGQEGRVWLQRFALELTEAGADDDFVAWARRFLTSPENFVIYYGGQPEEMTDEQKLRHMKGLAEGVRAILKDRLKKAKGK